MTNLKAAKILSLLIAASAFACSKGGATAEEPTSDDSSTDEVSTDEALSEGNPVEDVQPGENPPNRVDVGSPGRPELTSEECTAQGGEIIGDIGDGRIYEEAYMCPSGQAPTGNIVANVDGPTAVEGAVCCP